MANLATAALIALSMVLAGVSARPGAWGFAGAVCYAVGQLSSVLFVDRATVGAPTSQTIAKAWIQFFVAIFFGALAAEGFGPTIADMLQTSVRREAVWLIVGLSANAAWPVVERTILGNLLKRLGGGDPPP